MNGVIRIVRLRSFSFSRIRDARTAGTVQPNPRSTGRTAFPESPAEAIVPFMTQAILAI